MLRRSRRLSARSSEPSQPTALANGQFADEGHVVHTTEHAAISGLCDDQGLASQIAEGASRTTLLSQVTADQRGDELSGRPGGRLLARLARKC